MRKLFLCLTLVLLAACTGKNNHSASQNNSQDPPPVDPPVQPSAKPAFITSSSEVAYGSVIKVSWELNPQTMATAADRWTLKVNGVNSGNFTAEEPDATTLRQSRSVFMLMRTAGEAKFVVTACDANDVCTDSDELVMTVAQPASDGPAPEPTSVAGSVTADQSKRMFIGYYPSWSDNVFSAWNGTTPVSDDAVLQRSLLARVPGTYTHVKLSFVQPDLTYSTAENFDKNSWSGTGFKFGSGPKDIKRAIEVLQRRGIKVYLSVGGGSYKTFGPLAAENGNADGSHTLQLAQLVTDLGVNGLDIDYEVDSDDLGEYAGVIRAVSKAAELAGPEISVSLTGHPTGADCTQATGTSPSACEGKFNPGRVAGRLRQVIQNNPDLVPMLDVVNIMSYDFGYKEYDGVAAYKAYRDLFPANIVVNIGLEPPPEAGSGGAILVVRDADAICTGSVVLKNQFGTTVNLPYSVERLLAAAVETSTNSNPRDGALLWQVRKTAQMECGDGALAATPGTIIQYVSEFFGLPLDNRAAWQ